MRTAVVRLAVAVAAGSEPVVGRRRLAQDALHALRLLRAGLRLVHGRAEARLRPGDQALQAPAAGALCVRARVGLAAANIAPHLTAEERAL